MQLFKLIGVIVAFAMSLVTAASDAVALPAAQPRVLFICQYGTAKSAIAREVFRQRARERGIPVVTFSRGITPEEHISPALRARLLAHVSPVSWGHIAFSGDFLWDRAALTGGGRRSLNLSRQRLAA